jgi:hypothetical protein
MGTMYASFLGWIVGQAVRFDEERCPVTDVGFWMFS